MCSHPRLVTAVLSLLAAAPTLFAKDVPLQTIAEQSKYVRTGRYDEVVRLCAEYERTWGDSVRCTTFGQSPEGRPMLALVVSRSGALTPEKAREQKMPVMLMQ